MMDMTHIVASLRSRLRNLLLRVFHLQPSTISVLCVWTVKENGRVVRRAKNIFTNYGLSSLASAVGGGYVPPYYLVIDSDKTVLSNNYSAGATSIQTAARKDISGDTQLVINPGGGTQETVTFSAVTGSGPYTYTLTAGLANNHNSGETVLRQTAAADTLTSVISEVQYDATNAPNQRVLASAGYSTGSGNFTLQFYITAAQAQAVFNTVGLSEKLTVGQGNLHDHAVLGYDHTAGTNDVEIDVSITLTNV